MSTEIITTGSSSILVNEDVRPVTTYDLDGTVRTLGSFVSRVYQGEKVQRHHFQPSNSDKIYRLGPTSTEFHFVDHQAALQPWVEQGYRITKQHYSRGGLQLWAQLEPDIPAILPDPIRWDLKMWPDRTEGDFSLKESIIIITGCRPKKSIIMRRGWFRQVCTNGMVAEVLGLGSLTMSHTSWNQGKVYQFISESSPLVKRLGVEEVAGPWVGSRKGADRLATVIEGHLLPSSKASDTDTDEDEDMEDGELEGTVAPLDLAHTVPLFVRDAITPLARQPRWYLRELALQLHTMADQMTDDKVYALDLVNCVTSPLNRALPGQGINRPLMGSQPIIKGCIQLVGGMSLS